MHMVYSKSLVKPEQQTFLIDLQQINPSYFDMMFEVIEEEETMRETGNIFHSIQKDEIENDHIHYSVFILSNLTVVCSHQACIIC